MAALMSFILLDPNLFLYHEINMQINKKNAKSDLAFQLKT